MNKHSEQLEQIANDMLDDVVEAKGKPNYTNRDFMNTIIIFQTALMDKMYDNMIFDNMDFEDRKKMAESCGADLHKLIHTYTNLDTFNIELFL